MRDVHVAARLSNPKSETQLSPSPYRQGRPRADPRASRTVTRLDCKSCLAPSRAQVLSPSFALTLVFDLVASKFQHALSSTLFQYHISQGLQIVTYPTPAIRDAFPVARFPCNG